MQRSPVKVQASFDTGRILHELRAERVQRDRVRVTVQKPVGVEDDGESATEELLAPKRPTFLTVGRVVTGLSVVREAAEGPLAGLELELCEVNDTDVCAYVHRDEIRTKQRKKYPRQPHSPLMKRVEDSFGRVSKIHEFPDSLSLACVGLINIQQKDDERVSHVYLQFAEKQGDYAAMLRERRIVRGDTNFRSNRPEAISQLCLLGALVDYGSLDSSLERWAEAQAILVPPLSSPLVTSPMLFTTGIAGEAHFGPATLSQDP